MLKYKKQMEWITIITGILIAVQTIIIKWKGDAFCLNDGCRIVESLTTIPPIHFNMLGLVFFLLLYGVLRRFGSGTGKTPDILGILLISGMAVESVLLAYQITVARILCTYCLFIFAMVLLLNGLAGTKQLIQSIVIVVTVNLIFLLVNFGPSLVLSRGQTLAAGTYATGTCSEPTKELYLIFSEDCPHCRNVIESLSQCNSCDFHFNPVDKITSLDLTGLEKADEFNPEINRVILSLLDIETVPVLLVKNPDGYAFVRGEENIIRFVEKTCFRQEPLLYLDATGYSSNDTEGMSVYDPNEGECNLTVDCE